MGKAKTKTKAKVKKAGVSKKAPAKKTKKAKVAKATKKTSASAADWRVQTLAKMRALIFAAEPKMVEEQKWRKPSNGMVGVPVWSLDGIVCTGETYKEYVKLTFMYGASLPDPAGLFNAGFGGGTRRAIDIAQGAKLDERAFKALVKAAATLNGAKRKR